MRRISPFIYRSLVLLAGVLLLGLMPSYAQVSVSLPDVTGESGTSGKIPITVGNLTGQDIISFQFTITYDNADVVDAINGVSTTGSLMQGRDNDLTVNTNVPGQISVAFASFTTLSEADLPLLYLDVDFGTTTGVSALDFSLLAGEEPQFNEVMADPIVNGSVTIPDIALYLPAHAMGLVGTSMMLPVTTQEIMAVDGVLSYTFTVNFDPAVVDITGVSVGGTASAGCSPESNPGAGQIIVAVGCSSEIEAEGGQTLIYLMADLLTPTLTPSALTWVPGSIVFNEGTPLGGGIDGWLSVSANAGPAFTEVPPATTMVEGALLEGTFAAVDPEGADVSLTLIAGGDVPNASFTDNGDGTGAFSFAPDLTQAGVYTFTVQASDGLLTADASLTVTVTNFTENFEATLTGISEVPLLLSSGNGFVTIQLDNNLLSVNGAFLELVAPVRPAPGNAHIHLGAVGTNGGVVIGLTVTANPDGRSGTLEALADLSTMEYPEGMDMDGFKTALRSGGLYVNVHSNAYPGGEVRGQIVKAGNEPPAPSNVTSPMNGATYVIEGDPEALLFNVSWEAVADPDGDAVIYIWQISDTPTFSAFETTYFPGPFTVPFTVGETAELYDDLTNRNPGNIDVGGSRTLYHRVITSDGSEWTTTPAASFTLTRGQPTANEGEDGLPTEFTLDGNYPNPFNPSTTIRFNLPETAEVSVTIVDVLGREVMNVPAQTFQAGASRTLQLNASALASGTYVYRLTARTLNETLIRTGQMTLLK
jgi:hypothetical protein